MNGLSPDSIVHIGLAIVGVAWLIVQLKISNAIAAAVLLIEKHISADEEKHKALDNHFVATDSRVNRLEGRVFFGMLDRSQKEGQQ